MGELSRMTEESDFARCFFCWAMLLFIAVPVSHQISQARASSLSDKYRASPRAPTNGPGPSRFCRGAD